MSSVAVIRLDSEKALSFYQGHPWVYPKAIHMPKNEPEPGSLVAIQDKDEVVGYGVYNPHSLYRIRVLLRVNPSEQSKAPSLEAIIARRLDEALLLRQSLNLPNAKTNAFRLCNSEADGLSGLTIDAFDGHLVVSSSAFWVEANRALIRKLLEARCQPKSLVWRSQTKPLAQDGFLLDESIDIQQGARIVVREEGVAFEVDTASGQKTGLFLDQRDNHALIASLAQGRRVLDLYSYSGGFALHAAKAGASRVVAVDSSAQAIELGRSNATHNGLDNIEWIQGDAREYLSMAKDFDIVTLDPPKLIPSKRHVEQAKNYYRFLHREVLKVMPRGSLLFSCNCSSAISRDAFSSLVAQQAAYVGRELRMLQVRGPASCHPVIPGFPEGQYLSAVLFAVL